MSENKNEQVITKSDPVLDEILRVENDMTRRSLELLRGRYDNEKNLWNTEKNKTESELNRFRNELLAAESRLKNIQDEYTEEKVEDAENLKLSIEGLKAQKEREREKWDSVEQRVKFYKQVLEETQVKLGEERSRFNGLRIMHAEQESALRETIDRKESEILQIRNEISSRIQDWTKEKSQLEQEVAQLRENIQKVEERAKAESDESRKTLEKKDAALAAVSNALQETTVNLAGHQNNLRQIQVELEAKQAKIVDLEKKFSESAVLISEERRKWQESWENELKNWQAYVNEARDHEKLLRLETEERIKRIKSITDSLESQLSIERETLRLASEKNSENENKIKVLSGQIESEKKQRLNERSEFEAIIEIKEKEAELSKQQVVDQYEKVNSLKEREIARQQSEISQLNANFAEEQQLYQLEKIEKQNLQAKLEQAEDDRKGLVKQIEEERAALKKTLLEEQINFEGRLSQQAKMTEIIKKQREEESMRLQGEIVSLNEQFSELRNIYQGVKIENEQRKARVNELETEVQKLIAQTEVQRKDWENLLISEQQSWEQRCNGILSREGLILKSKEEELRRLETAVDELTAKLIATERMLQDRDLNK
jgi:hypothetical protein